MQAYCLQIPRILAHCDIRLNLTSTNLKVYVAYVPLALLLELMRNCSSEFVIVYFSLIIAFQNQLSHCDVIGHYSIRILVLAEVLLEVTVLMSEQNKANRK